MFLRKKYILLTVAFTAMILTSYEKAEIQQNTDTEIEEQEIQAGAEKDESDTEEIDDILPLQQEEDIEKSSISAAHPEERIDWAFFSEDIYCYSNGKLYGYLSEKGEEISPCVYEEAAPFSEGLACVFHDGKYGYIGKDGETVLPFIYDQASSFREGTAYFSIGEEYGLIDQEGNVITELTGCDSISSFREGLAYFSVDGRYGYMDKNGRIIIEPVYDDAGYFYDGLAVIMKNGLFGVIGKDGNEVLTPDYSSISREEACILAQKEAEFFFFDKEGNEMSSGKWDDVSKENDSIRTDKGIFYIYKDGRKGFADQRGNLVLEPLYEEIRVIPERKLVMVENEEGEYGVLDYAGQVIVPFCHYDYVEEFVQDRAVVELNGKYGVIRYDGTLELPIEYDKIKLFTEDSMAVWTEDTVELRNDQGDVIIAGEYETLYEAGGGYFSIDGETKFWDRQGTLICECDRYDLTYNGKNTYILDDTILLKMGEEDEGHLDEVLLTNQITPRIGTFASFLKDGSITTETVGPELTQDMDDLRGDKRYSKLFRMADSEKTVLYFYAAPWVGTGYAESYSGFFIDRDGQAEPLYTASECGGTMRGDEICFWYDKEDKALKLGIKGFFGGFGGYSSSGLVYALKGEEAVKERSFGWVEIDSNREYSVDGEDVSEEAYRSVSEQYREYQPI